MISYDVFDWVEIGERDQTVRWVTGGAVFLALVSWADDLKGLNPLIRLASQLGTVVGVMICLPEPLVLFNGGRSRQNQEVSKDCLPKLTVGVLELYISGIIIWFVEF